MSWFQREIWSCLIFCSSALNACCVSRFARNSYFSRFSRRESLPPERFCWELNFEVLERPPELCWTWAPFGIFRRFWSRCFDPKSCWFPDSEIWELSEENSLRVIRLLLFCCYCCYCCC